MVGDMFTNDLKAAMSGLCSELSIAAKFQTSLRYTAALIATSRQGSVGSQSHDDILKGT